MFAALRRWLFGDTYYVVYDNLGKGNMYYVYKKSLFGPDVVMGGHTNRQFAEFVAKRNNERKY